MELYIVCTDEDDISPIGVYTVVNNAVKKVEEYLEDYDYWEPKDKYKWSYGSPSDETRLTYRRHRHIWIETVTVNDGPIINNTVYLVLTILDGAPVGVFFQKAHALNTVDAWPDGKYATNDKDRWDLEYGGQIILFVIYIQ